MAQRPVNPGYSITLLELIHHLMDSQTHTLTHAHFRRSSNKELLPELARDSTIYASKFIHVHLYSAITDIFTYNDLAHLIRFAVALVVMGLFSILFFRLCGCVYLCVCVSE